MTKTAPRSSSVLGLGWMSVFSPSKAAQDCAVPENLKPAAIIYAAFLLCTALFYSWKPFDFPDRNAVDPRQAQGFFFWLRVMVWQPPLEAAWIVFLLCLLRWFREGKLFFKLLGAVIATALPFILLVAYRNMGLSWGGYAALAAVWLAGVAFWAKGVPAAEWRSAAAFMLAVNFVGILALAPMVVGVLLDSEGVYKAGQIAGGLWVLVAATVGLRQLTGQRLPRCFMSVLLSMFMQIAFAFTLHMLGLVPKDILKALLYA